MWIWKERKDITKASICTLNEQGSVECSSSFAAPSNLKLSPQIERLTTKPGSLTKASGCEVKKDTIAWVGTGHKCEDHFIQAYEKLPRNPYASTHVLRSQYTPICFEWCFTIRKLLKHILIAAWTRSSRWRKPSASRQTVVSCKMTPILISFEVSKFGYEASSARLIRGIRWIGVISIARNSMERMTILQRS